MSMPVITVSSSFKTNMSHTSSHIDESREAFVLKLVGTKIQRGLSSSTISSVSRDHRVIFSGKNQSMEHDSEIDVFDAEKYFNEGSNQSPKHVVTTKNHLPGNNSLHPKKHNPLEILAIKEKAHNIKASSIVSEAASNNSRSTLLHTVQSIHQPKRTAKKSFLTKSIGCDLLCCDKNYVDIDDKNDVRARKNSGVKGTEKSIINGRSRQVDDDPELRVSSNGHFSLNSQTTKVQSNSTKPKSLQVFGSPIKENGKEKRVEDVVNIPSISTEMQQNDGDSDSSSDLFEIENFTKSNNLFLTTQESGDATACDYAPSEASIEWSVVTASAADFSVISDHEEVKSNSTSSLPHQHHKENGLKSLTRSGDECSKRRSSALFMGCKSHKAVSVIGDAHKTDENGSPDISARRYHIHRTDSFIQMTRFYDESKKVAHELDHARNRQRSFDARVLP